MNVASLPWTPLGEWCPGTEPRGLIPKIKTPSLRSRLFTFPLFGGRSGRIFVEA